MSEEIKETFEINELFNEWKKFLSWCYENNDKTVEIHRDKIEYVMNYITNLQKENQSLKNNYNDNEQAIHKIMKENELHGKILKDANDVLNIQAQKGNYNYDSYMLGLYNGMEMIVSLFEQREPKLKCGKDIKFLHETDYKSRNEKAIEWCECVVNAKYTADKLPNGKTTDMGYCLDLAEPLLNILQGGDE